MNANQSEATTNSFTPVNTAKTSDRNEPGMDVSRRNFLRAMPKIMTGTAIGAGVLGLAPTATQPAQAQVAPQLPWPYQALDPDRVAERAYAGFYAKGCMYGVFESIVGELRDTVGGPYTTFPMAMMEYGKGGVNGTWGTLCGTLNGACAAINLASSAPRPIIDEILYWYNQESLPNYRPLSPKFEIVPSICKSPICHASVQRWCEVSGFKPNSPQRAERCGWLTACVAKYTAQQLNQQAAGAFKTAHQRPADPRYCVECHTTLSPTKVDHGKNMDCAQCHSDIDELHWYPSRHVQIRWKGGGVLEQAPSPAGPWSASPNQNNPQAVPLKSPMMEFFRLRE